MAEISAKDVKALRESTGAGMMDCKKALQESNGDLEAAKRLLREKGLADAAKKTGRAATEGIVYAYMHRPTPDYPPKLGVLIELNCETDFVAKTEKFERLAKDIAMHISFADPSWSTRDQVPQNVIDEESSIYAKRSEEHTSELQSRQYLVCRLLLEKKKTKNITPSPPLKHSPIALRHCLSRVYSSIRHVNWMRSRHSFRS